MYITVAIYSLFILLLMAIFLFPLADAYKIEMLPWTLKEKPYICFDVSQYKWSSLKAMHLWNENLPDYNLKYTFNDRNCNIFVEEKDELPGGATGTAYCVAQTKCHVLLSNNRTSYLDSEMHKVKTILHEIGHTLSLGHTEPETAEEALKIGVCHPNIMWAWSCDEISFPDYIKEALDCRHLNDGIGRIYDPTCMEIYIDKL